MGNAFSSITEEPKSNVSLPSQGPPGPQGPKGERGPPGDPNELLDSQKFRQAVTEIIDPSKINFKNLNLEYDGIQDSQSILKLYGVNTDSANYYLLKGGDRQQDNISISALGNIDTRGSINAQNMNVNGILMTRGARILGNVDQTPTGNFWLGLNGSGSEPERLAIAMIGDSTTGNVNKVQISKDLEASANATVRGTLNSQYIDLGYGDPEREGSAGRIGYGQFDTEALAIVGKGKPGVPRKVHMWDDVIVDRNSEVRGSQYVNGNHTVQGDTYTKYIDFGFKDGEREPNAGKMGYGLFDPDALGIVGKGKPGVTRKVHLWDDVIVDRNITAQGRVWSGTVDGGGGMWVDGEKRGGQFMGSRDPNSLGWYSNGDWRMWHENAGNQVIAQGRLSAADLVNRGNDFFLGTSDESTGNGRGSFANGMNNGRAMVKYYSNAPDGTRAPVLYLNFGGDFPGGVRVSGPSLMVDGNLDSYNHTTLKGGKSEHNPNGWQTHFPYHGDQKNYIRGDTEIRGNTNNIGNLSVGGDINIQSGKRLCFGDTCLRGDGNGKDIIFENKSQQNVYARFMPTSWDRVQIYKDNNGKIPYFYVNGGPGYGVWNG